MVYKHLNDLDTSLWRAIVELYKSDPLTHCYLVYDLLYEFENTNAVFSVEGGTITSYILLWSGPRVQAIHLWGGDIGLLSEISIARDKPVYIHLYSDEQSLAERVAGAIEGSTEIVEFYDMVVDEENFREYRDPRVRKLGLSDVEGFMAIKKLQGREVSFEEARRILLKSRYYGVYVNGVLVAIAGRYIALPEVWVIGDVFVHPDYRGQGFGRAVTSAVTRDAVYSGATALLHVDTRNTPAIKLYESLGYKVLRKRIWILVDGRSG